MSLGSLDQYQTKARGSVEAPVPATGGGDPFNMPTTEEVSLQDVLQVLRKRWAMVVGITCATIVLAGVITLLQTPIFRSQTTLLVEQHKGDAQSGDDILGDLMGMSQARSLETQVE